MTLFDLTLRPGQPIFNQVVLAARKALLSGEYRPSQTFPSVRTLAARLKIHPNTAHKIIQRLIQEGWLEVHPGIGTLVAEPPKARAGDRRRLLRREVEHLVVEAKRVGLRLQDVVQAISDEWSEIDNARSANDQ
jgi:GntR family transcriptional regulator